LSTVPEFWVGIGQNPVNWVYLQGIPINQISENDHIWPNIDQVGWKLKGNDMDVFALRVAYILLCAPTSPCSIEIGPESVYGFDALDWRATAGRNLSGSGAFNLCLACCGMLE